MNKNEMAQTPYLDMIANYCHRLSKQELTDLIVMLAKQISASDRHDLLEKIKACRLTTPTSQEYAGYRLEEILVKMRGLEESIRVRVDEIKASSFGKTYDQWGKEDDHGYYDEEPEYVSTKQGQELEGLFKIAEDLFLNDCLADARQIYEKLFNILDQLDQFSCTWPEPEFDLRQARARYCRCIYETEKRDRRLTPFTLAMRIDLSSNEHSRCNDDDKFPLLQDVMDTRVGVMPDLNTFLPAWRSVLAQRGNQGRAAELFLETVHHSEGLEGVALLARKWKHEQPKGYLFWLECLKANEDYDGLVTLSDEALAAIPPGEERERIAEYLITAAEHTNDSKRLLSAKREKFFSQLDDQNLLDLVDEAQRQEVFFHELTNVMTYFKTNPKYMSEQESLYIKVLLLAGQLDPALQRVKKDKPVGWSYASDTGIVFGAVLYVLTGYATNTVIIRRLLNAYANSTPIYSGNIILTEKNGIAFGNAIIYGLKAQKFSQNQLATYLEWAETIGKRRIEHIVGNQHRDAYDRAALVLGALAEVHMTMQQPQKAKKIIQYYYKEKFNRFSEFCREVEAVVTNSHLLKALI